MALRLSDDEFRKYRASGRLTDTTARHYAPRVIEYRRHHPEQELHREVVKEWRTRYPATFAYTNHSPNGMMAKNPKHAAIFEGLGMKAGVFDLVCIAARGHYAGLAIELKSKSGTITDAQSEWQERYMRAKYMVVISNNLAVVLAALAQYHALPDLLGIGI